MSSSRVATRRGAARPGRPAVGQSPDGILDIAERLVQTRGYNGFSYADIAAQLGVTKASLHYHFATKAALGCALIERYATASAHALAVIDRELADPCARLRAYAELYGAVLRGGRMCLCGMLAAEVSTLPAAMQRRLNAFFDHSEAWLVRVLEAGRSQGRLQFAGAAVARARGLISMLEGAMLVARMYGDAQRFLVTAEQAVADLCARAPATRAAAPRARRRGTRRRTGSGD